MQFDIITCGSATLDVFAHTDNEQITVKKKNQKNTFLAYPAGGKILIQSLKFELGGGGTNTAVGFARQGYKVGYVGALGNDETAIDMKSKLKDENVTFLGSHVDEMSGYSILLDSKAHDRTALVFKGANDKLNIYKIPKAKVLYVSSMLGQSLKTQIQLAKAAKKNKTLIAYNPSLYQVTKGKKSINQLLKIIDILIFNKEEAQALTKQATVKNMHKTLQAWKIPVAIITDGPHQVTCSHKGYIASFKPKNVKVIEATGAGDAFASGFVGTFLYTHNIAKSLGAGQANSQSVLQYVGAKRGLLGKKKLLKAKAQGLKMSRLF